MKLIGPDKYSCRKAIPGAVFVYAMAEKLAREWAPVPESPDSKRRAPDDEPPVDSCTSRLRWSLYACARLLLEGENSMICFALDRHRDLLGEQLLASGNYTTACANLTLIQQFAARTAPDAIMIACNYVLRGEQDVVRHVGECNRLHQYLYHRNIRLLHYIITDGFDFEALI